MSGGALDGIRVLEFSQIIAGPVVGVSLSDLGADVIKVEPPGGEPIRNSGSVVPGESKAYQSYNRGKRGIVLDLHDPRGLQTAYRLIPHMDVVVTNYRPGVVQRIGIDYETLRELREDLIYLEATGFGTTGPEAHQGGNDGVIRAYSGIAGGDGQTDEHGAPIIIGASPIADYSTAIAGAMGICAALFHRERTGKGQYIGASLLRSSIFIQGYTVMREPVTDASVADVIRANIAEARARGAPWTEVVALRKDHFRLRASGRIYYGSYNAKDGPLVLGALTTQTRNIMRELFDMQDERSDSPDFDAADPDNWERVEQWQQYVRDRLAQKTVAEWMEIFDREGVPAAPTLLVERGRLKTLLTTRNPVQGVEARAGNRRGIGPLPSNLIVGTDNGLSPNALGEELMALAEERGNEFGIVVRRLSGRSIVRAVKAYPDGREVPIRKAELSGFSVSAFKDIVAVSETPTVHTLRFPTARTSTLRATSAVFGSPRYDTTGSVVLPDLLFEEVTLRRPLGNPPKPPVAGHPYFEDG